MPSLLPTQSLPSQVALKESDWAYQPLNVQCASALLTSMLMLSRDSLIAIKSPQPHHHLITVAQLWLSCSRSTQHFVALLHPPANSFSLTRSISIFPLVTFSFSQLRVCYPVCRQIIYLSTIWPWISLSNTPLLRGCYTRQISQNLIQYDILLQVTTMY